MCLVSSNSRAPYENLTALEFLQQCFALLSGNSVVKIDFLLYKVSGHFPFKVETFAFEDHSCRQRTGAHLSSAELVIL